MPCARSSRIRSASPLGWFPAKPFTLRLGACETSAHTLDVIIRPIALPPMQLVMAADTQRDQICLIVAAAFLTRDKMMMLKVILRTTRNTKRQPHDNLHQNCCSREIVEPSTPYERAMLACVSPAVRRCNASSR